MFDPKQIKAFTFDTGGTVLDWHTGFKKGFEKLDFYEKNGFKSDEMANLFRKKSLEIITSQGDKELVNFDTAHKMALEQILNEKKIKLDKEDIRFLSYEVPANLKVWKDFLIPFEELRKKVLCVSFTLLSNRLVFLNSKANKINWDLILSCETLEVYKPNINAYLKTAKMLQLNPEECVMVACHSFDLNAAKKAGFNTIFVKRINEWGPDTKISIDGNYDIVIENFNELKEIFD
ncbi:MAG: haloacid dehalogenase [Alphaproteobacteria bacterium]|nr:MAG: haloacid dehalogenase [Alphaproteobacteria bacterium]